MKIKLEVDGVGWRADMVEMSGSPPCGVGKKKEEAVANLFCALASCRMIEWVVRHCNEPLEIVY